MRAFASTTARKTTGTSAWDEQVYSQQGFAGGAYASVRVSQNYAMFGLNSDPLTDASYLSIDYAFYVDAANVLRIYEAGALVVTVGAWAVGDLLEVVYAFDGSSWNVTYLRNGVALRSAAASAGLTLYFDSSYFVNGELKDIRFGPNFGQPSGTFTASAGVQMVQGILPILAAPGYDIHLQSESQDADGAWQSHNTLQGVDWTTSFKYRGDGDTPYVSGVVELARADRTLSMAPLVTGSLVNRNAAATYAPFLDVGRRIRVRTAILPEGVLPFSGIGGAWTTSGVTLAAGGLAAVNNGNVTVNSFHTDTAVVGSYIQVDMGAAVEFDQIRLWEATAGSLAQWKVQGSPDAATWTDIRSGFNPNLAGPNIFYFPRSKYRYWRLTLTNAPGAGPWVNEAQFNRDWREVFDGYIDKVGIGGRDENAIVVECRDLGALLIDTDIEVIRQYGSSAGTAVETVMQSILDDNLGAGSVVLYTPVSPNWLLHEFSQKLQSVMEAIRALAKQIGYEIRYVYDANNVLRLTFYAPDRAKTVPDYALSPAIYTDITKLDLELVDVRNAWTVEFIDRATGNKLFSIATSAPSIAQYKRRPAKIAYGYSSNIDSMTEADKMTAAAVADTAFPKALEVVDVMYYPIVDLSDFITLMANGEHYDKDQQRAIFAYEHDLRDGDGTTTLTTRGKPAGGYDTWMSMVGGVMDGPSLTVLDTPGATPAANHSVSYSGSWDTIQLKIDAGAWIVPSASPISVTPNAPGGAAKQYSFRAIKNGQIVTQTVYVATAAPLPPAALIDHRDLETDDTIWYMRFNARAGAGGGGANLTWALYRKIGFAATTSIASGDAITLPYDAAQTRHPRTDIQLILVVTDIVTGLSDTASITVPASRPEITNTANPYRSWPYDDNDYGVRSSTSNGLMQHTSVTDSRSALINTMHRTLVDTLDNVINGAVKFAAPVPNAMAFGSLVTTGTAITLAGNTATAGAGALWDNQVYSKDGYTGGAYASAQAGAGTAVFGLNTDPTTDASYASIDYCWDLDAGSCFIYESGGGGYSMGAYAVGDSFAVTYDGQTIKYTHNGVVNRTVAVGSGIKFYFDSSFYANGRITGIEFGPLSPSVVDTSYNILRTRPYSEGYFALRSSSTDGRVLLASDPYFSDTSQYVSSSFQRGYHNLDDIVDSGTRFAAVHGVLTLSISVLANQASGAAGPPWNRMDVTITHSGMPTGTVFDISYNNGVAGGIGEALAVALGSSGQVVTLSTVTYGSTPGKGTVVCVAKKNGSAIAVASWNRNYLT